MIKRNAPLILLLLGVVIFAGCETVASWFGPAPSPPVDSVSAWRDIDLIFMRVEMEVGSQTEIEDAREALGDADGDGEFPLSSLTFLVESQVWTLPDEDPLGLYSRLVRGDANLSEAGVSARTLAADQIRRSLIGIAGG